MNCHILFTIEINDEFYITFDKLDQCVLFCCLQYFTFVEIE